MTKQLIKYDDLVEASLKEISEFVLNELGLSPDDLPRILSLFGTLLSADVYSKGIAAGLLAEDEDCYADKINKYLQNTTLYLTDDKSGIVQSSVQIDYPREYLGDNEIVFCVCHDKSTPFYYEITEGNTYYVIQNLNIYLTADVVHQLNINPKEVINNLHNQIKEEITKIEKDPYYMPNNNEYIAVDYTDETLRLLVEEFITMQKAEFSYQDLWSYVLYWAKEEGRTRNNGNTLYESNKLHPVDCERINSILRKIIHEGRISVLSGDSPYFTGPFREDARFKKTME